MIAAVADLNKRYQQLQNKEKTIDKELGTAEQLLQAFQTEKQRALNEITVAVPLKLGQIRYLVGATLLIIRQLVC